MTEIKIVLDTDGGVEVSVKGHKGRGCKALTADVEKLLGVTLKDDPTTEMFERETVKNIH